MPVYQKLGAAFKGHESVVIAKIDATANDLPEWLPEVKGFPTLFFAGAGGTRTPVSYEGDRTLADMKVSNLLTEVVILYYPVLNRLKAK